MEFYLSASQSNCIQRRSELCDWGCNPRGGIPRRSAVPLSGCTCVLLSSALAQQLELLNFFKFKDWEFSPKEVRVMKFLAVFRREQLL